MPGSPPRCRQTGGAPQVRAGAGPWRWIPGGRSPFEDPSAGSVWLRLPSHIIRRAVDEKDLAILASLQENARATYADVGARVGLSASSVHDRVRKLERRGVIRVYRADVDPAEVGLGVTALVSVF